MIKQVYLSYVTSVFLAIITLPFSIACKTLTQPHASQVKIDSPHSVISQATLTNGSVITTKASENDYISAVHRQLMYLVGQSSADGIGVKLPDAKIKIIREESISGNSGLVRVYYDTELLMTLNNRSKTPPEKVYAVVPLNLTANGERQFYEAFHESCTEVSTDITGFYYYIRPWNIGNTATGYVYCPLADALKSRPPHTQEKTVNGQQVSVQVYSIKAHPQKTSERTPEYERIWADNRLEVSIISGTYTPQANQADDSGFENYRSTIENIIELYGKPIGYEDQSTEDLLLKATQDQVSSFDFNTEKGLLRLHSFVVRGLFLSDLEDSGLSKEQAHKKLLSFEKRFSDVSATSDLIIYTGHSGRNVQKIYELVKPERGRYYIMVPNGCESIIDSERTVADKIKSLNPGESPFKYLDIVANSLSSPAHEGARTHVKWINAIVEAKRSYSDILKDINPRAKPVVYGEEDNPRVLE